MEDIGSGQVDETMGSRLRLAFLVSMFSTFPFYPEGEDLLTSAEGVLTFPWVFARAVGVRQLFYRFCSVLY